MVKQQVEENEIECRLRLSTYGLLIMWKWLCKAVREIHISKKHADPGDNNAYGSFNKKAKAAIKK